MSEITVGSVIVTQIADGMPIEYRGRNGGRVQGMNGARWSVALPDGTIIGRIERRMMTRETKSKGNRYVNVNARWQSLGWEYARISGRHSFERPSKKAALESLIHDYNWHQSRYPEVSE